MRPVAVGPSFGAMFQTGAVGCCPWCDAPVKFFKSTGRYAVKCSSKICVTAYNRAVQRRQRGHTSESHALARAERERVKLEKKIASELHASISQSVAELLGAAT